ncbi:MAG: trigger factor [Gemmatimonadota bacterium]|nr:trigger factor [Gemmatimonadota bacterium]MDH5805037.1 trigger factor [Gemmatimonadota bacterium]
MSSTIQITRTGEEPGVATLAVEAPVERVKAAEKKAVNSYAKQARLPGFRKGKAPLNVIRKRFGHEIREAVIQELVQESWKLAIEQEQLEPISHPSVKELSLNEDEPLKFELQVEVKPKIVLDRISGFSIERKLRSVTDAEVDEQIEELRKQRAPWVPVEGEKAAPGDLARVTIATLTDGEAGEAKPYDFVIGQDQALPALEEEILQMEPDQTKDASIAVTGESQEAGHGGNTISARIHLLEIKRQKLADLDDGFAREVGNFDTLDALKAAVREDLENHAKRDADAEVRRRLIEQIATANEVPAPRPLVDRIVDAYRENYGIPVEQREKFAAEFEEVAQSQVRRDLILDFVSKEHKLEATEEDLDERIEKIAERSQTDPGKVYATLQKENRIRELEHSVTEEKVFDFLLEQSTIQES